MISQMLGGRRPTIWAIFHENRLGIGPRLGSGEAQAARQWIWVPSTETSQLKLCRVNEPQSSAKIRQFYARLQALLNVGMSNTSSSKWVDKCAKTAENLLKSREFVGKSGLETFFIL